PFDLKRLEVSGPPAVALSGVASNPNGGGAQIAASESGTIVYQVGPDWSRRSGRRADRVDGSRRATKPAAADARELGQSAVLPGRRSPRRRNQRRQTTGCLGV